jgi:chemotaxis protein MotB
MAEHQVKKAEEEMPEPSDEKPPAVPLWMITFADMSSLLMACFVMLYSFSSTDTVKYKDAAGSLKDAFGVTSQEVGTFNALSSTPVSLDVATPRAFAIISNESAQPINKGSDNEADEAGGKQDKGTSDLLTELKSIASEEGVMDEIGFEVEPGKIILRARGKILFESGSAKIKTESYGFLKKIAFLLKKTSFSLSVDGHTDDQAIRGSVAFPSNWELSAVRATTVIRFFALAGVEPHRLKATGFADSRPLVPNNNADNRAKNRRVEFIFTKESW